MRSKCFTNKNGTRCKGEKVVEILQSPLSPPPPPTGITRDRPIMISVITVIIYNSNKFDEDDDNNYEGKFT